MRRGILALSLIATHAVALGMGLAMRENHTAAPVADAASSPPEPRLELSQFIVPIKPEPEEEEEDEGEKLTPLEAYRRQDEEFAKFVAAIPADADVEALVKAGSTDPENHVSRETEAAYAVWLDRDALAALRWHEAWERDKGSLSAFDASVRHFLNGHTTADVDRLLTDDPEAGRELLMPALYAAKRKGLADVVAFATGLSSGADRATVIDSGIRSLEGLGPHLPALCGALDPRGMREFLSDIGRLEHAADLSEAVHAAGFSEDSLKAFDETVAASAEAWRLKSLPLADVIREGKADESSLGQALARDLPDFSEWVRDFADSRLSADEMFTRVKAALPGSTGMDPELRRFLFTPLFRTNPAVAIEWLKESQRDAWQGTVKAALEGSNNINFENLIDLSQSLPPGEMEASGLKKAVRDKLYNWQDRDPLNSRAAVQQLPAGPLKEELLEFIKKLEAKP